MRCDVPAEGVGFVKGSLHRQLIKCITLLHMQERHKQAGEERIADAPRGARAPVREVRASQE